MSKTICICKNITDDDIIKVIKSGVTNIEDIKKNTGVTSGACRGSRCTDRIEEIIKAHK